jgi:secreted PhoX family phosphatase
MAVNLPPLSRRNFIGTTAGAGTALALGSTFWQDAFAAPATPGPGPYGSIAGIAPDANGLVLPPGFTSRVIGRTGEAVPGTSYVWPTAPDGMGTFATPGGGWILVVNAETVAPLGGGASAIEFDASGNIVGAQRVLGGTQVNCAGGPTPWGTWMSCEEFDLVEYTQPALPGFPFGPGVAGQVWECDPTGVAPAVAHPTLGFFSHEAVAVDPATNVLYLTEDQGDSHIYRFTPSVPNVGGRPDLSAGLLEVMVVANPAAFPTGTSTVTWAPVPDPTANPVPTRKQVPTATKFNRGEGMWFDSGVVYFTTTGDDRVWAFTPATSTIEVVYDFATAGPDRPLEDPDNITVHARSGDLFVAEDDGNLELVLITNPLEGNRTASSFMRITGQSGTEVAGVVFDPAGDRLYFSSQRGIDGDRGITYEVTGPFRSEGPDPVIPESPLSIALPVGAVALGGAAMWVRHQRMQGVAAEG